MLKAVSFLKNNHVSRFQIFVSLIFVLTIVGGCAAIKKDSPYVKQDADELLLLSHTTPSTAEKIQIRGHLAQRFPDTIAGMYSKAYLETKNFRRDLELKYLEEMVNKYPDDPNTLHYQSFEGGFDEQLAIVKRGMEVAPEFLNYNFIIKMVDIYADNKDASRTQELFSLIDGYEEKIGDDIYVFDFARGLVHERITKDAEQALEFFELALDKKGSVMQWGLWESYFDTKYPKALEGPDAYDYVDEVKEAVSMVDATSAPDFVKRSIKYKLIKNLLADKAYEADYRGTDALYKEASEHYFTSEVVSNLRSAYIKNKKEHKLLALFEDAVKRLPDNPDALGLLAAEYAYIKEYDKAETYYKRAINNSYEHMNMNYYTNQYASKVLYPTYRADDAIELLEEVVDTYPEKRSDSNRVFSMTYLYAGSFSEAKIYFDKYKSNWKGDKSDFPKYLEDIFNGYVSRQLEITGNAVEVQNKTTAPPKIVATTSAFADWVAVTPDQSQFLGSNGSSVYALWDANKLTVVDNFENAILDDSYAKTMINPVISPDGRYVAYATEFEDDLGSVVLVYDIQEGHFSHQLPMIKKTSGLAWSPDGKELAIWNYGRLIKYDLDDREVVLQGEVKGQDGADVMFWTANGKYLALLERSSDGSIRVFDADTLEQLHRLDQVNWPHALGVSIDGRYIFSADNRSTLHKWDTEKEFAHESIEIPVLGRIIIGHPTKPQIIINDWRGRNYLTLIDYEKMEILETQRTGEAELRISYINDGEKILAANFEDDSYEIYDARYLKLVNKYIGESAVVTGGAYAYTEGDQLVTWDQDGLHVWSVTTGEKLHSWPGNFQSVMIDHEYPEIIYGLENDKEAQQTYIGMFDLDDFTDMLVAESDFVVDEWALDDGKLIMSGRPYMPMDEGFIAGAVMICDIAKDLCNTMFIDMVTEDLKYDHLGDTRFTHLAVSPDLQHIALSTAWEDGWKQGETLSEVTRIFSFETGDLSQTIEHVGELVFKDNETLAIAGDGGLYGKSTVYSIKSGDEVGELGEDFVPSPVGSHDDWPNSVSFPERNLSIEVSKDNRIEFYNAKDEQLALTILAKRDNAWIAFLPTGEFSSSENGADKIYWQLEGEKLSMAEAVEKYKRADVIKSKLQAISEQ